MFYYNRYNKRLFVIISFDTVEELKSTDIKVVYSSDSKQ
jgi:hypothetical protein